jgi:hypothetical protein
VKITIEEAPAWIKALGGKLRGAAERGLEAAAHRVVETIQTEVIPREERIPVDRGIYRAGWRARKTEGGALVYNNSPHAPFIEDGVVGSKVKPGRKMIDALAAWVRRKGLTGGARKEEKIAESRRIAFAIAKSMQAKGIFNGGQGLKILEKGMRRAKEFMEEEVKAEIERLK